MTELIVLTDYFVIAGATNPRQVQAIGDEIVRTMQKLKVPCVGVEGLRDGRWALLDYGDVVVHVFDEPTREFYSLEHLWGDAPRVRWQKTPRAVKQEGENA
jgi:ribosome-associated protein